MKYQGESSELIIGDDNIFREGVTVNPGTKGGGKGARSGSNKHLLCSAGTAYAPCAARRCS